MPIKLTDADEDVLRRIATHIDDQTTIPTELVREYIRINNRSLRQLQEDEELASKSKPKIKRERL